MAEKFAAKLVGLEPTREQIEAGAKRLVSWEDNSRWPDSWSPLQVAAARNEAERVWRSMWDAASKSPSFQAGVAAWMDKCFIHSLYSDMTERGDRLLEEVLELLQSKGYDRRRVGTLVDYVYSRPVGDPGQEVGGVMITLAGFCHIAGLDMANEGNTELARITQPEVMAKIRAKQEAKNALHFDTPLPGHAVQAAQAKAEPVARDDAPIAGRWHHGNGFICCGGFRIAREDWEAGVCSAPGMRDQVFDWVCATLNYTAPPAERVRVPDGMTLVPQRFLDNVRAASQPFTHPRAVPVLLEEAIAMLSAATEADHG